MTKTMSKTPTYVIWGVNNNMDQFKLSMIAGDPENKGVTDVTEALNFAVRKLYSPSELVKVYSFVYAETLNAKVRSKLVKTSSLV